MDLFGVPVTWQVNSINCLETLFIVGWGKWGTFPKTYFSTFLSLFDPTGCWPKKSAKTHFWVGKSKVTFFKMVAKINKTKQFSLSIIELSYTFFLNPTRLPTLNAIPNLALFWPPSWKLCFQLLFFPNIMFSGSYGLRKHQSWKKCHLTYPISYL